jgi:SAM-dependent methyltransferase
MADASLPLYYEKIYHKLVFNTTSLKHLQALFANNSGQIVPDRLFDALPAMKRPARILEIGMGLGNILHAFKREIQSRWGTAEIELCGTEYNTECAEIARKTGIEAIIGGCREVYAGHKMPFDIIILSHVLEHIPDLDIFMAELLKLASEETYFYIEVPGILALHTKPEYDFDVIKYFVSAHIANYNFRTLKYHMGRYGLACLAGNEAAYGIFRLNPTPCPSETKPDIAQGVLFYLVNMEATFAQSQALAARLRAAEASLGQRNIQLKQLKDALGGLARKFATAVKIT